jgi:chromate transporter
MEPTPNPEPTRSGDSAPPTAPSAPAGAAARRGRLGEVAVFFLRLGWTAFGGPAAHIAMMRRELVQRRKWVSEARFLDLLGLANVIPGPSSTELAIYLGYERAGWPGLLVAGVLFILPAMLIVLAFAWTYAQLGTLPQAGWVLYGIKPVIIAIILQALVGLARIAFKTRALVVLGLIAFALYLWTGNAILVIFGAGIVMVVIAHGPRLHRRLTAWRRRPATAAPLAMLAAHPAHDPAALASRLLPHAARVALAAAPGVGLLSLFLVFLKVGAVTYGSGYTLLAFLRTDLVVRLHWLTDRQLLDAIAVGQFTPGPVFTTATFIGYLIAGFPGALVATLGIFLPSFALVAVIYPLGGRIRQSPIAGAFLDGVNVAAVALIAGVLIQLGQAALVDPFTVVLAAVALLVLLRFNLNSAWLMLGGALVGAAVHLLHAPL